MLMQEELENAKGVIRRTDNAMAKRKRTNNNLQIITQKNKDRATRTPLKTWGELRSSGRISRCCPTCDTHRVTLVTHPEM